MTTEQRGSGIRAGKVAAIASVGVVLAAAVVASAFVLAACGRSPRSAPLPKTGCLIGGKSYQESEVNPANPCEHCRAAASRTSWSPGPDFTPCTLVTSPDRAYDICSSGRCVSPGCGDSSCNAPGPNWKLPSTGQTTCYDDSAAIACPGTPGAIDCAATPFCGQDAQRASDEGSSGAPRFSRSGEAEAIVTDGMSGLVWQGCVAGRTGPSCDGTDPMVAWDEAVAYCEGLSWAGLSDWRLPDQFELQSIVDFGRTDPSSDPIAFPAMTTLGYWASSTVATGAEGRYQVSFSYGFVGTNPLFPNMIRCVRGGRPGIHVPRLTQVQRGVQPVVVDAVTGLEWQGCAAGQTGPECSGTASSFRWREALAYCEALRLGGTDDWYLPNIRELLSIVDDRQQGPPSESTVFPAVREPFGDFNFWSSTTFAADARDAWQVDFYHCGETKRTSKAAQYGLARCVRNPSLP